MTRKSDEAIKKAEPLLVNGFANAFGDLKLPPYRRHKTCLRQLIRCVVPYGIHHYPHGLVC